MGIIGFLSCKTETVFTLGNQYRQLETTSYALQIEVRKELRIYSGQAGAKGSNH